MGTLLRNKLHIISKGQVKHRITISAQGIQSSLNTEK